MVIMPSVRELLASLCMSFFLVMIVSVGLIRFDVPLVVEPAATVVRFYAGLAQHVADALVCAIDLTPVYHCPWRPLQ